MYNIFHEFAEMFVSAFNELTEEREKIAAEIKKEKEEKERQDKYKKQQQEYESWSKATDEEHKNPDEWRILPYGWSPFGIYI